MAMSMGMPTERASDVNAAFEEIAQWDEQLIAQGAAAGIEQGRALGLEEGKELGMTQGMAIGREVGFYHGCFLVWKTMMEHPPADAPRMSDRAQKAIASFGKLLETVVLENRADDDVMHNVMTLRAKFKVITSLLGIKDSLLGPASAATTTPSMSF